MTRLGLRDKSRADIDRNDFRITVRREISGSTTRPTANLENSSGTYPLELIKEPIVSPLHTQRSRSNGCKNLIVPTFVLLNNSRHATSNLSRKDTVAERIGSGPQASDEREVGNGKRQRGGAACKDEKRQGPDRVAGRLREPHANYDQFVGDDGQVVTPLLDRDI